MVAWKLVQGFFGQDRGQGVLFGGAWALAFPRDKSVGGGCDHHFFTFSTWMAGRCITGGQTIGSKDDFGLQVTMDLFLQDDLYAAILNCMGMYHEALTYRSPTATWAATSASASVWTCAFIVCWEAYPKEFVDQHMESKECPAHAAEFETSFAHALFPENVHWEGVDYERAGINITKNLGYAPSDPIYHRAARDFATARKGRVMADYAIDWIVKQVEDMLGK